MTNFKHSIILIIIAAVITTSAACSTTRFEKNSSASAMEYGIFDTTSVTGTGFKLDSHTHLPRKCIKNSETSTTGGQLNFEFIDPSSVMSGERGPYRDFIRSSILRASDYNITGMEPFSVICIISVSGRRNYIIDNSIQLTALAESFLKKNDLDGFYNLCGTQFIDSTLFESDLALVVTYYMPHEEIAEFKKKIEYGKKPASSDILNFRLFREAGSRYPVFFSVSSSTGSIFIPLEFPIASGYGYGEEDFIKPVIQSCLASDSGRITSLKLKKWIELPDVNRYLTGTDLKVFREETHDSVEVLTREMRDYSLFRTLTGINDTDKNNEKINWGSFYKCIWGVRYNSYINPENEKDCTDVVNGLGEYRQVEGYEPVIRTLNTDSLRCIDTLRDLRLVDRATLAGQGEVYESLYRFNDNTLYADIPDKVTPGQTMDAQGRLYSSDCIKSGSISYIDIKNENISSLRHDCYPVEMREKNSIKKFFTGEKAVPGKPFYRGSLEITGFSRELSDDFVITEEAQALAVKNIIEFYKKYGTHYVNQVRGRRGIVYYFYPYAGKDNEITVNSYGLSSKAPGMPDEAVLPDTGCGCISFFTGIFMNMKRDEPLLHPATVKDFFASKNDFVRILNDGSESVPVEIYLKPWSQYLADRGIIRIDQTVPLILSEKRKQSELEGKGSITESNGDSYEGTFSNGLKNGYGIMKTRNGSVYKGGWFGDLMHGRGTYIHRDGNIYTGDFMYGYPHGTGENKSAAGNIYRGSIVRGKITGQGELLYKDGRKYSGEFLDGEPYGYGTMEYPDGKKIQGDFKKGILLKK